MQSLTLYSVDTRGRINLDGIVDEGVEFYQAEKAADGVITLHPVEIAKTTVRRPRNTETASALTTGDATVDVDLPQDDVQG